LHPGDKNGKIGNLQRTRIKRGATRVHRAPPKIFKAKIIDVGPAPQCGKNAVNGNRHIAGLYPEFFILDALI
jgi:hypothetical protein